MKIRRVKIEDNIKGGENEMNDKLATHEMLELHELLSFKTLCVTKVKTMMPLVSDQKLKDLMKQDLDNSIRHIQELVKILSK
jgi:similar to spore coat protein